MWWCGGSAVPHTIGLKVAVVKGRRLARALLPARNRDEHCRERERETVGTSLKLAVKQ